jgi:hypothetical protein
MLRTKKDITAFFGACMRTIRQRVLTDAWLQANLIPPTQFDAHRGYLPYEWQIALRQRQL